MAIPKKEKSSKQTIEIPFIPLKYQHGAAIAVIFLSLVIFFHELVFEGKVFLAADNIASKSFQTLVADAEQQGIFPLWNPYIFCGMPGYASLTVHGERYFDISALIINRASKIFGFIVNSPDVGWVFFYYLILGAGMYWFVYDKLKNKIAALVSSLAVMHSTYVIILVIVGHMTKVPVIAFFPFIFLILEHLREKFSVILLFVLTLLIHFMFLPGHIQMIFYCYFAIGIYYLFYCMRSILLEFFTIAHDFIINKNMKYIFPIIIVNVFVNSLLYLWIINNPYGTIEFLTTSIVLLFFSLLNPKKVFDLLWNKVGILRSAIIFVVATCFAFLMTGDQYLSTLEYSKYSIRGSDPIVRSQQAEEKGATNGGLDYEYATNWSFSPGEMITFFIPSAYGFGGYSYSGALTQNQEFKLNTYFGNMPFTDAPQYMGIVIIVLAGIGAWRNRKDHFVQYLVLLISISILISFGKEFSLFYDLMFNYFPMFNKFRIPSMILILVQIMIPILAAYGIVTLMNDTKEKNVNRKKIYEYILISIGVLLILSIVAKDIFISIYEMFFTQQQIMQSLTRSYGTNQMVLAELYKVITGMISNDIIYGLLFLFASLGGLYLYQVNKLKLSLLTTVLVGVVLSDLWRINFKPMDAKPHSDSQDMFATPKYVTFIKQDSSLYRTLEFEQGQPPYSNTLAYWRIQSAYGYQGVKMRQIQDVFDVAGLANPLVWGLMNVKYILSDRPDSNQVLMPIHSSDGKHVLYNRAELPRAFFVNRYEIANGLDILNKIKEMNFSPRDVAFFMEDPKLTVEVPQAGAEATYTHLGIQDIALKVTATGNNLLFLSESWYPEGWKAYIDGNETSIYRVNYMFRGIVVPQGEHTLTMSFEPTGFYLGKNLSLGINLIVLAGLGYFGFVWIMKRRHPKLPAA